MNSFLTCTLDRPMGHHVHVVSCENIRFQSTIFNSFFLFFSNYQVQSIIDQHHRKDPSEGRSATKVRFQEEAGADDGTKKSKPVT